MTVMALALAHTRENECDTLEGHAMYDSVGEVVGWLGQVMDDSGYPCEYMGMGGEGYTSCWSSSEISRLRDENAELRELAIEQRRLADAIHAYWADGMNQEQFNMLMRLTARVDRLCDEIGIGVDT